MEDEFRDFDAPKDILEPLRVNRTLAETGEKTVPPIRLLLLPRRPRDRTAEKFGPDLDGIGDKKAAFLDFGTSHRSAAHTDGLARRQDRVSPLLRERASRCRPTGSVPRRRRPS